MLQTDTKPIFLVDAMLGNIARKLRIFGYDSEYSSSYEDDELIEAAKREDRILITKDVPLSKKAAKQKIPVICVSNNNEIDQLTQIFKNLDLEMSSVSGNTSRCTECNGKLESVEKKNVINKVPDGVIEKIANFWKCSSCDKIYWEGTHIQRLQKFVDELNEKL